MDRTPMVSMSRPDTIVATPDVRRNAVITHGSSETDPRSAATSGRAAATARPSKAASATITKIAVDAGKSSLDKTLRGVAPVRLFTAPAYDLPEELPHRRHPGLSQRLPFGSDATDAVETRCS
jgi:hypothetical protein